MKYTFILLTFFIFYSCKNSSINKITVREDEFLTIPKGLKKCSKEKILQKFSDGDVPKTVFANDDMSVTIVLSLDEGPMTSIELSDYSESVKMHIQEEIGMEWISNKYQTIDNHKFSIMKYYYETTDEERVYNIMCASVHEGKLVMITFSCNEEYSDEWDGKFIKALKSASFTKLK